MSLEHFESHVISLEKKFTSKNFASVIISLGHFESHVIFLEKKFNA
jgi:Holliday junction resolvasome RuvABC endonuclease subunit